MNRTAGSLAVLAATLAFAGVTSAWAQEEMYPGQSVVVNPGAGGTQVLLYPDNQHTRVVPVLRQPGDDGQIIHLHMPVKHRVHVVRAKPKTEVAAAEPAPAYTSDLAPPPAPAPKRQVAAAKPQPQKQAPPQQRAPAKQQPVKTASNNDSMGFSFGGNDLSKYAPQAGAAEPSPAKVASGDKLPTAGLTRRSQILFAANAADPAPGAHDAIKMLGGDLNNALAAGAERIQLQAYGGGRNDKSSLARRLSLKRALAIRNILIEGGVPAQKIDVRAMGGASDGATDRVDVFIRG